MAHREPTHEEISGAEDSLAKLKHVLAQDPNLTEADREAELKKARIALMRNLRSPVTPHTSMEDFSQERDQAKAMKDKGPVFDADAVNSKLAALGHDEASKRMIRNTYGAQVRNTRDVVNHTFGEALPATNSTFVGGPFDPKSFEHGQGMMVEGPIRELRHHTLVDGAGTYHRFLAIVIDVQWGHNRTYDANGTEIETEQATMDRIRTGYARWELVEKKDPNALNATQILTRLKGEGIPKSWYAEGAKNVHPAVPNRCEFWADRQILINGKLAVGEVVRIKTKTATHFADSVWLKDSTALTKGTSYAGENVGDNWADKVEKQKGRVAEAPKKKEEDSNKDGVADDEW